MYLPSELSDFLPPLLVVLPVSVCKEMNVVCTISIPAALIVT